LGSVHLPPADESHQHRGGQETFLARWTRTSRDTGQRRKATEPGRTGQPGSRGEGRGLPLGGASPAPLFFLKCYCYSCGYYCHFPPWLSPEEPPRCPSSPPIPPEVAARIISARRARANSQNNPPARFPERLGRRRLGYYRDPRPLPPAAAPGAAGLAAQRGPRLGGAEATPRGRPVQTCKGSAPRATALRLPAAPAGDLDSPGALGAREARERGEADGQTDGRQQAQEQARRERAGGGGAAAARYVTMRPGRGRRSPAP
jgi:hypothetical protein